MTGMRIIMFGSRVETERNFEMSQEIARWLAGANCEGRACARLN